MQTLLICVLLLIGYALQYLFKYRRDRGYGRNGVNIDFNILFHEGGWFVYIIPNLLHLIGYITSIIVFKIRDNEQFQCLIERVFIISCGSKILMMNLWAYFAIGLLWLVCSTSFAFTISDDIEYEQIKIEFLGLSTEGSERILKLLLVITICFHDLVQIIVLVSYCINCYLLRYYLHQITDKLWHHTIETLEWMRELSEFQKSIKFLNRNIGFPVCIFLMLNLIYAFSGIIFLIYNLSAIDKCCEQKIKVCIGNTISWLFVVFLPFYQAAKLNNACQSINTSGHHIRVRPFVHHNTLVTDLDSIILFASSLKISAKLFQIPIFGNYLCFVIVGFIITLLTVGLYLNRE